MELTQELESLAWILAAAAITPLLLRRIPGVRIPEVAVLLILGVLIGPSVLGLAETDQAIDLLAELGLGFLFLMAGYELEPAAVRGRTGRRAVIAWVSSLIASLIVVGLLERAGFVAAYLPVAIALTSTALGALLPMFRDSGELPTPLGKAVLANGAVGEFGPILAISLFLSTQGTLTALISLAMFAVLAILVAAVPRRFGSDRIRADLAHGHSTSAQTAVRTTVLLLAVLLMFAADLGLDIILGAFIAGIILRQITGADAPRLEAKLDGVAFGFFIPIFFVTSGMAVDVESIVQNPGRLVVFFVLIALIRGVPALLLFRSELPGRQPLRLALYTATGLPIIVAITQIGLATGVMLPENAAALVGAGLLTVLIFPLTADRLRAARPTPVDAADAA